MKIKILHNGSLKKIIGTKYFIVSEAFSFVLTYAGKKYLIKVPVGFITDFGSIPPVFFNFDKSKYISYILHDYLYSLKGKIIRITGILEYNQAFADDILNAGLKTEGMIFSGRVIVRVGLEIGGRFNFQKVDKKISNLKKNLDLNKILSGIDLRKPLYL